MSTERTSLFALFLCLAAAEAASGNAVTVLTSRVARQRHPELPCALTLVPPLFQRADNDSAVYAPRLFVYGTTPWLDEFLRRFPSVATIYVFTTTGGKSEEEFEDFFLCHIMPSASIVLDITRFTVLDSTNLDRKQGLPTWQTRIRYIAWLSLTAEDEAEQALVDNWLTDLSFLDLCNLFFRVMVTVRPRGTTHVFSVPMLCDMDAAPSSRVKAELLGVWSPGAGWPSPDAPIFIFPPLCASWRPPPDGESLRFDMFIRSHVAPFADFRESEAYEVVRLLRERLVFQNWFTVTTMGVLKPLEAAGTCRLDAVAFPRIAFPPVSPWSHSEISTFPWMLDRCVCIVPAGAGKPHPLLYPITAEYTPAVWAALAAVVLVVVACLYLMRRDESVQELFLQTLSPLLGQPLDDRRPGPQKAVLGGWLLVCVVVVGAYQGQLLGFITVPPQNREINSWDEWLESDL
ncbi:Ionotropic receptor 264, partial [Frankliniella occidentalis]